jgi:hypothetical protein
MLRLLALSCLIFATCQDQRLEKTFFFKQPRETRLERMRHYSLEDQYRIYRFGHDKIEPPALELAIPIAEKGPQVTPFLLERLRSDKSDLAVRDILYLLQEMLSMKTFDARNNPALMQILNDRVPGIKNEDVQYASRLMLEQIKNTPERP